LTAETETVVESAAEELVEEVEVAEIEELKPVIVAAEELPEIVPGLAVPESPALPEDDSTVAPQEVVTPESNVESVDSIVATPVETIAKPE
jgi:hypothetical protein